VISCACYWASIQLTSTFIIAVKIGRSRHGHYQGFVALMKNAAVVMFRCWRAVTVWCVVYIGMYWQQNCCSWTLSEHGRYRTRATVL